MKRHHRAILTSSEMKRHHRAILTSEDVELIRQLNEERGIGYKRLAKKFDVGVSTIRDVCTYRTW